MSWSKAFASFASVRQTLNFNFSITGSTTQESTMSSSSEETRTKDIATLERPHKKNRDSDSKTEDGTPSVGVSFPNSTPSDAQSQGDVDTNRQQGEETKVDGAVSEGAIISLVAPSIANSIVAIVKTSLSGEPSLELNESLKKAATFSDRFKTAYERGSCGEIYIPPILENWIFFARFIMLIPAIRSTITRDQIVSEDQFPAFLGRYTPGRKGPKSKEFRDQMGFFWDICLGENLPFVLEATVVLGGIVLQLHAKERAEASVLLTSVIGIAIPLTSGVFKAFSDDPLMRLVAIQARDTREPFLVIGPIVFVAHHCLAKTAPLMGLRKCKGAVFNSDVVPKLPQSACAYILSEQLGEEDFEVMGLTRRLVLRLPSSDWHKKATGFAQTFACRCSKCVKELNVELRGTGSKLVIS
jgi:hypothetical protein